MIRILKRYKIIVFILIINIILLIFKFELGRNLLIGIVDNLKEMFEIMFFIFILFGFFDVWVEREIMIKFMGEDLKVLGILLFFY